jgi:GAF domain-containing protein
VGLEAVGTLNLYHFRLHRYSGEELKRTELFCRMAGVAIQTARRLKGQLEKIGSLSVLSETSQRIFQAVSEEEACRVAIQAALRLVPCERASAFMTDEEKGVIEIKYGLEEEGRKSAEPFSVPIKDVSEEVLKSVRGFLVPFYAGDLPAEHPELLPFICSQDLRSVATAPVALGDRLLGVIVVSHREPFQFRLEQLEPLRTIGNLLSLALERLDLVEKMRARQKEIESALSFQTHLNTELLTLQQLSAALVSSLELKEILTMVVEGARASLGFNKVLISLLDPSEKFLERKAWTGIPEEVAAQMATQKPPVEYIHRYFHDRFRISRSYFIGHHEAQGVVEAEYSYVDRSRPTNLLSEDAWHPEDLLITPLHARDGKLIGIMSVDDPGDGKIPSR